MIEKRQKLTVGTGGPHRLAGSGPGPAAYTHSGTAAARPGCCERSVRSPGEPSSSPGQQSERSEF